jgi:hypothetical protein
MNRINVKTLALILGITMILVIAIFPIVPTLGMSFNHGYLGSRHMSSSVLNNWGGLRMSGIMMGEGFTDSYCPFMNGMYMGSMVMMGGPYHPDVKPIGIEAAVKIAEEYMLTLRDANLEIDEVEEYSNNYYVSIKEKDTSRGVIELIIDRFYGTIHPEPQSIMWNQKYSMMGFYNVSSISMSITPEKALKIAQGYLDVAFPGTKVNSITTYYGYYTIMITLNGKHYGMLSVDGYTGQVWYHTWHGMFLQKLEE